MNKKFSIIVPVYNCEESMLRRCFDSLANQTSDNYEVILIDDGSTNRSEHICDEYGAKYSFFHVYHQKNGGVTRARNNGISKASGDWIIFVDNDDSLRNDTVEKLENNLEGKMVEIVFFDSVAYYPDHEKIWNSLPFEDGSILNEQQKKEVFLDFVAEGYNKKKLNHGFLPVWCKAFSRRFIEKNQIRFYEDMTIADDIMFNIDCLAHDPSGILYIQLPLYLRYLFAGSDGNSYHPEIYKNDQIFIKHLNDSLSKYKNNDEFQYALFKRYLICIFGIAKFDMCHKNNTKSYFAKVRDLKSVARCEPYKTSIRKYSVSNLANRQKLKTVLLRYHLEWLYILLRTV